MKMNAVDIRPGHVIEHKGRLLRAVKVQHTQPGKGGAYMQVELKDVRDGTKYFESFRSAETLERARLDQDEFQFLFGDGEQLTFMDKNTFEQIQIAAELVGEPLPFLEEGMMVTIESHDGNPISISLPRTVVLEVKEADPVVKGQTAASSYKPAMLENGVKVMVPPHIETGMKIVVNTDDASYVERAK